MKRLLFFLLFLPLIGWSQQVTISGTVADVQEPLPGVNVIEKGTLNGTISDFNGNYEITVSSKDAILVFSYVGFKTQEIAVADKSIIDHILEEDAAALDEVVVKGFTGIVGKSRRRTESIQTTAESVTALNSVGIEKAGITNIASFSNLVPNLKFNTSQAVGINFITVRGIPQIRGGDAPIAFVIDGVTIPDPSLLNQELFDLALIEVVKGPQGALYGKNAIGGAINIFSKEPTNTISNKLNLGYENGNTRVGQFVSSGALKKNKIYYRFSALYKDADGLLTNEFLDQKVDFKKDINLRGQIKANLSNAFKAAITYQYYKVDGGATYFSVNPTGNLFVPGTPGGALDPNPRDGNNVIVSNRLGVSDLINNYTNLKLDYNFENVKLQSITSYNKVERSTQGDFDFLEADDFTQNEITSTETFNQEIRLQNRNTTGKFNWSLGGFYQKTEEPLFQDGLVRDFDTFEQFNVIASNVVNETTTIALFGFSDYKLTDKLTASFGFRYDFDTFSQEDLLFDISSERKVDVFQPKASLAYQANEKALFYFNYGKGYRTGGFNPGFTSLFNRDFKDEITDSYEVGYKTSWWNNRFIFNGSFFYTDFQNQQQFILDLGEFIPGIYNYEESRIIGFEVDTRLRLTKFLDVIANYGFVDAKIIEGGVTGGINGDATDNTVFNGNKSPFVPVDNLTFGLESSVDLSEKLQFNGFANWSTTGKTYWHESNRPEHATDAYSLLDARIAFKYNKKWELAIFGRNLLDTQYYQEFSPGEFFGSPEDVGFRGQPLSIGAALSVRF